MLLRRTLSVLLAPALLGLAACGPVSVEQAERACLDAARDARAPRGEVGFGVGFGLRVGVGVGASALRPPG